MTIEELLVFGKSHCHSDHAKLLLANLVNRNPLELLNYLEEEVSNDLVELYKKEVFVTGTEIAGTMAASFFIPGIDIVYFFTTYITTV